MPTLTSACSGFFQADSPMLDSGGCKHHAQEAPFLLLLCASTRLTVSKHSLFEAAVADVLDSGH